MNNSKVGLLPLYLQLYDQTSPGLRTRVNEFVEIICGELKKRHVDVVCPGICRIKPEFKMAVEHFEQSGVDAIITLHLAYSPSLESYEALIKTDLPLIVLDTTPTYIFDNNTPVEEIMFNHGIHGVQDLCNLLKRNNKAYHIEAGHWQNSDVVDRVVSWARAARMAAKMKTARVGIMGVPFKGMGDFAIPFDKLKKAIGIDTVEFDFNKSKELLDTVSQQEIDNEIKADKVQFNAENIHYETHYKSVKAGLALRKWIKNERLDAFTVNFLNITKKSQMGVMPFLEIEKQMAEGIGYAGEGDVLTAALAGALASEYKETSFTEMFCPDWKNDTIFLSHMGEMNISLAVNKPELVEMDFPYTDAENPAIAYGLYRPGQVALVNLAPVGNDKYTLIIAKGEIISVSGEDKLKDSIHAWFKPECNISEFLARFSMAGGTHHSAMCYTPDIGEIKKFSQLMGWNTVVI